MKGIRRNTHDDKNREAIRQPLEAAESAIQVIHDRMEERQTGVVKGFFNIPELSEVVRKPNPGDQVAICGRPRNGKSFFGKKLLLTETLRLYKDGLKDNCTICITWEEPAEVLAMAWMAHLSGISSTKMLKGEVTVEEFDKLNNVVSLQIGSYPIYIIGGSMRRLSDGSRRIPDLNLSGVEKALNWIMNDQMKDPTLIMGDYVQNVPNPKGLDMPKHVMMINKWFGSLTYLGCPVLELTQAKQEIEKEDMPLPSLNDSEWSSSVGQSADFFMGVFMPKTKYDVGTIINNYHIYRNFKVTENLMFIRVSKQKHDRDG